LIPINTPFFGTTLSPAFSTFFSHEAHDLKLGVFLWVHYVSEVIWL